MRRIFKYPLEVTDSQELELPVGAQMLSVTCQRGKIMLYAIVDTKAGVYGKQEKRNVRIFGTGHVIDVYHGKHGEYDFLGTVQMKLVGEDELVWHIFIHKPAMGKV